MAQKCQRPALAGADRATHSFAGLDSREINRTPTRFQAPHGSCPAPAVQRISRHLARCGERAIAELLVDLIARHGADVLTVAETYQRIDPAILRALGADHFPPALFAVPQ